MRRWLLLLFAVAMHASAWAHKPSDSYLTLRAAAGSNDVAVRWDIALRDLDFAIGLDQDGDGKLTWDEIRARHGAISAYALERLKLSTENGPCAINIADQLIDLQMQVVQLRSTIGEKEKLPADMIGISPAALTRI